MRNRAPCKRQAAALNTHTDVADSLAARHALVGQTKYLLGHEPHERFHGRRTFLIKYVHGDRQEEQTLLQRALLGDTDSLDDDGVPSAIVSLQSRTLSSTVSITTSM